MKVQLEIIIFLNKDTILYSNFIRIVFNIGKNVTLYRYF